MVKKKDKRTIWVIALAILALLLFAQPGGIASTSVNLQNIIERVKNTLSGSAQTTDANLGDPNKDFVSIRLYDKNGNLIQTTSGSIFSTVLIGGVTIKNVYFIDYTIMVDASTSGMDIKCDLTTVGPSGTAFDDTKSCGCIQSGGTWVCTNPTIPHPQLNILAGRRSTWTSNKLALPGAAAPNGCLLSPGVHTILATVSCTYFDGSMDQPIPGNPKTGSIGPITFSEPGAAAATVTVSTGGIPQEFCGDGMCQSPLESSSTCSVDCSVIPNVRFRTGDLSYVSGGAIAYTNLSACGSPLAVYGYNMTGCFADTSVADCAAFSRTGYTKNESTGLPGSPAWAAPGSGCLLEGRGTGTPNADKTTTLIMTWKQTTTYGPCSVGYWGYVNYSSTRFASPYQTNVSNQTSSFDLAKEKTC
jgi:hypothetical protein